jgi:hypothetical protein
MIAFVEVKKSMKKSKRNIDLNKDAPHFAQPAFSPWHLVLQLLRAKSKTRCLLPKLNDYSK